MGHNHHHVYPDEIGLKSPLKLDYTDPLMRMGVANTYLFGGNILFNKISLIWYLSPAALKIEIVKIYVAPSPPPLKK